MKLKIPMQNLSTINEFNEYYNIPECNSQETLFKISLSNAKDNGLFLEFGVFEGKTINFIAQQIPDKPVYGFDSFQGLSENWPGGIKKGEFKIDTIPKVLPNVCLVVGLIQNTLETFCNCHPEPISFIHVDIDLYSSTKDIFHTLAKCNRIRNGMVIQFDEFFVKPKYCHRSKASESEAFKEFVEQYDLDLTWLAYYDRKYSVVIKGN